MNQSPPSPQDAPSSPGRRRRVVIGSAVALAVVAAVLFGILTSGGGDTGERSDAGDVAADGSPSGDVEGAVDAGERDGPDDDATDADGVAADGDAAEAPDATEGLPAPQPDSTQDPQVATEDATVILRRFLELSDAAYQDPDAAFSLEGVANGAAASEVESTLAEFRTVGYRQVGGVAVDEVSLLDSDLGGDPPSLTLSACIDATQVAIDDEHGQRVRAPSSQARSLHHYDIAFDGERWQVISHGFPDDADC